MRKRFRACTLSTISIGFAFSGPASAAEFVGDAPASGFVRAAGPPVLPFPAACGERRLLRRRRRSQARHRLRDGLLSPTATLIIPTFVADDKTVPPPPLLPEIDRVYFNGDPAPTPSPCRCRTAGASPPGSS